MIKGRFAIIGDMEIEGEKLTGAFIECSREELKKGRSLFCENVTISASQSPDETEKCPNCVMGHYDQIIMRCSTCGEQSRIRTA